MALNVDQLQAGLEDYRKHLDQQRRRTQANFTELQGLFSSLFSAYAGQMADEFRTKWGMTAQWFDEYLTKTKTLDESLRSSIEELRKL